MLAGNSTTTMASRALGFLKIASKISCGSLASDWSKLQYFVEQVGLSEDETIQWLALLLE